MKIILKEEEKTKQPVFADVKIDQFFVNNCGSLCQKYCRDSYNIITSSDGKLCGGRVDDVSLKTRIFRVLPEVLKIEF